MLGLCFLMTRDPTLWERCRLLTLVGLLNVEYFVIGFFLSYDTFLLCPVLIRLDNFAHARINGTI